MPATFTSSPIPVALITLVCGCYLSVDGPAPADFSSRYGAAGVVSLRGEGLGDEIELRCLCLGRRIAITSPAGEFAIHGLPAGSYAIDYKGEGFQGSCDAELTGGRYRVSATSFFITEITEIREPGPPFNPARTWLEIPCEFGVDDPEAPVE